MSCPALSALRAEAARVFGAELHGVVTSTDAGVSACVTIEMTGCRFIDFAGRSKAAARKLALETLRAMASKGVERRLV